MAGPTTPDSSPDPRRSEEDSRMALEFCPNCSAKLIGQSCKLKCPRCGYFLSCSDYY